jgi:hypothetical protein
VNKKKKIMIEQFEEEYTNITQILCGKNFENMQERFKLRIG